MERLGEVTFGFQTLKTSWTKPFFRGDALSGGRQSSWALGALLFTPWKQSISRSGAGLLPPVPGPSCSHGGRSV